MKQPLQCYRAASKHTKKATILFNHHQHEMPLTEKERLSSLKRLSSFPISKQEKSGFNAEIYRSFHKNGKKQFTVRRNKATGELRVWRLK